MCVCQSQLRLSRLAQNGDMNEIQSFCGLVYKERKTSGSI